MAKKDLMELSPKELAKQFEALNAQLEQDDNLLSGGEQGKRLSIRGSVFRQIVNGEEVNSIDERALNVIIVKSAPVSRIYYDKAYSEDEDSSPTCWSSDCDTPDDSVPEDDRQADKCIDCPQNIKGSGQGDSRACAFKQKSVVVLEGAVEPDGAYAITFPGKTIFGSPNKDGSKMPLQAYAKFLDGMKAKVPAVVTEMRFDSESSTPKLTFRPIRPISQEEMEVIRELQKSTEVERMLALEVHKPAKSESTEEGDEPEAEVEAEETKKEKKKKKKKKKPKPEPMPEPKDEDEDEDEYEDDDDDDDDDEEEVSVKKSRKKKEPEPVDDDLGALLDEFDDD